MTTSPRRAGRRSWRPLAVAGVTLLAGLLFAVSARTSSGTGLRADQPDLRSLVRAGQSQVASRGAQVAALQKQVDALTRQAARSDGLVAQLQAQADALAAAAGLTPVTGPSLTVTLNDAPAQPNLPVGVQPDDLVVHQQDVQAVVNALWAGGATAIQLQDQRLVATSAVRCVGNTLILQGRVYSPPYRVIAIGDPAAMRAQLLSTSAIQIYLQYVDALGLGWSLTSSPSTTITGYRGAVDLPRATVPSTFSALTPVSPAPSAPAGRR